IVLVDIYRRSAASHGRRGFSRHSSQIKARRGTLGCQVQSFWRWIVMRRNYIAGLVVVVGVIAVRAAGIAQQSAVEAPAGFDTPTLAQNPGSQSTSNGILQPPGDDYALDQARFEQAHDVTTGLGRVLNPRACAECHQNPVTGGASQFTEVRAGHKDDNGDFVAATVSIND